MAKDQEIGFGTKGEDGKIVPLGKASMKIAETLAEAAQMHGEDVVVSMCNQSIVISAQAVCRRAAQKEGATAGDVQKALDNYKPGVVTRSAGGGPSMASLRKALKGQDKAVIQKVFEELGIPYEEEAEAEVVEAGDGG